MYFVKYGDEYLHDPKSTERTLVDLTLDCEENSCGFCDFTIYPTHPMYNTIKEHGHITVFDGDVIIFSGYIYELGKEFYLDGHVKCKGDLAYLNMSLVKPCYRRYYTVNNYLNWVINNHNSQVDDDKKFKLGEIQDRSLYFEIKNDSYKTSLEEISNNLLDKYKLGRLSVRIKDGIRYLDYTYKFKKSEQIIDFGVNLKDYTLTDNFENLATYIIATGAKLDYSDAYVTLRRLPDGPLLTNSDFVKEKDKLYSKSAVEKYGWIGKAYSNTEIDDSKILLEEAVEVLKEAIEPSRTIEVKAIDIHLLKPNIKPISIGDYVLVRSSPHKMNTYFLCKSINLDLSNPENTIYTLGKKQDTFTSTYKKEVRDAVQNTFDEYIDDINDDSDNGQSTSQTTLKQINVKTGAKNVNSVSFVYETVTYKPSEPEEGWDVEDSDGTNDNDYDYGNGSNDSSISGSDNDSESSDNSDSDDPIITTSEESYACEFDTNGRLIKFGSIPIVWT